MTVKEQTMSVLDQIAKCGIIPVIVLDKAAQAVSVAKALLAGGIGVMEITFRTAAAQDSIKRVVSTVPEMLVGAGTVLSCAQMEAALSAGAQFIVSPGIDEDIIAACKAQNVPIIPGAVTPTEIMTGLKHGLDLFKFFPSESFGGLTTIKALCAPFPDIKFLPTGGISEKNIFDYIASKHIAAVGGSWMASAGLIDSGSYDEITKKAAEAIAFVKNARKEG